MSNIYSTIAEWKQTGHKAFAMLIDPDKFCPSTLYSLRDKGLMPDLIMVGGSLVMTDTHMVVNKIRNIVGHTPIVLFPGDYTQLSPDADALLFLSLVSGRNAEYLIGQHIKAAPRVRQIGLESIPTGYMLIDGGRTTSVQYVSNTMPLPSDKPDLAAATAMAAEMLGMKMIYLEAGSGALHPVSQHIIRAARDAVSIPIMVGGGLRTVHDIETAYAAGADIVVVGTAIESDPALAAALMMR